MKYFIQCPTLTFTLFIVFCQIRLGAQDGCDLLYYKGTEEQEVPVRSLYDWEVKKRQIIDSVETLTGKLPEIPTLPPYRKYNFTFPPFSVTIIDSLVREKHIRYNIRFTVAEGETVLAYLYTPNKHMDGTKHPAMLALPPTTGRVLVDGKVPYARELADRGYVVLATEYPGIGELKNYDFESDRYESGIMKGVFNHIRCIDFLQTRKDVDPERIGVIGHSLGGHSAIFVGVFDTRIKVIVSSVGWTLMEYYQTRTSKYGGRLGPWAQDLYAPLFRTKYNLDESKFPFNFDELIAFLAPRYFYSNSPIHDANFNVEGVRKGIANATEVYRMYDAENNIQVRYPIAGHAFPDSIREDAYKLIDKALMHVR